VFHFDSVPVFKPDLAVQAVRLSAYKLWKEALLKIQRQLAYSSVVVMSARHACSLSFYATLQSLTRILVLSGARQ
jgi:hypothetical protein